MEEFQQPYKKDRKIEDYRTLFAALNALFTVCRGNKTILTELTPESIIKILSMKVISVEDGRALFYIWRFLKLTVGVLNNDPDAIKQNEYLKQNQTISIMLNDYWPKHKRNQKRNIAIYLSYLDNQPPNDIAKIFRLSTKQVNDVIEEIYNFMTTKFKTIEEKEEIASTDLINQEFTDIDFNDLTTIKTNLQKQIPISKLKELKPDEYQEYSDRLYLEYQENYFALPYQTEPLRNPEEVLLDKEKFLNTVKGYGPLFDYFSDKFTKDEILQILSIPDYDFTKEIKKNHPEIFIKKNKN
jgi:hypothetical protein